MRKILLSICVLAAVGVIAPLAVGASAHNEELYADLAGSNEAPDPGAPNGKGTVEVTLNDETGKVCWQFKGLSGLEGKPLLAHIHKGKAGKAGDVVVGFGDAYKRKGCVSAPKATILAILKKPGGYYVNIHNDKYPGGVIRGQLEHAEDES